MNPAIIALLGFAYAAGFILTLDYALNYFVSERNGVDKVSAVMLIAVLWVIFMPLHWWIFSPVRSK